MPETTKYIISENSTILQALIALNSLSNDALTVFVVNDNNKMVGTLTDGDIRRALIKGISIQDPIISAMKRQFLSITSDNIEVELIRKYKKEGITLLPCIDETGEIKKIYNLEKYKSILPIDAVLMAGGKGERLRPLTEKTPKPLLGVGNKAIIDHNIDNLLSYGISNIHVTVNYLKEQIEEHYEQPREGTKIFCVREPEYLGTMGSIKFVPTFQNDTILVMNSDLFTNINYEDYYLHFKENDADMSVAAIPYSISVPYGIFELENQRNIIGIKEKPTYNYFANAGIYLIKKELLDLLPDNQFYNATDFIELLIKQNYKVIRFPLTGYWIDIGKHEDYKKAQELVKHL